MNETITELKASKIFDASADQLYKAWTTPEELKQWWQPMGNKLKEANLDIKEGGSYKYLFVNDKGENAFEITGQYNEVKEGEKLVYSWNWKTHSELIENNEYDLTISFIYGGSGSRI